MPPEPPAILTDCPTYAAPCVPTIELRARDSEVQRARNFTTDMLGGLVPAEHLSDVVLCVSELVTNAVRAARRWADVSDWACQDADTPVHLGITCAALWTRLDVRDPSPIMTLARETGPLAESGRGFVIVAELAADYWLTVGDTDKTMHAIIPMPGVTLTADELAEARQ